MLITSHVFVSGSSPLTRGKRVWVLPGHLAAGLIPAHAGKTPCPASSHSSRRAHPRSRGENTEADEDSRALWGSSPLTRGKHDDVTPGGLHLGLIPAHAGKTAVRPTWRRSRWAHPRSRGENLPVLSALETTMGSSPLTRGKPVERRPRRARRRLIPAHAGKTARPTSSGNPPGAHPRSRGENTEIGARTPAARGSSPLTRGKLADQALTLDGLGLIPAHAGKTRACRGLGVQ